MVGEIAAEIFNTAVTIPQPDENVALGAAPQAAWALTGTGGTATLATRQVPHDPRPADEVTGKRIRQSYAEAQQMLYG